MKIGSGIFSQNSVTPVLLGNGIREPVESLEIPGPGRPFTRTGSRNSTGSPWRIPAISFAVFPPQP